MKLLKNSIVLAVLFVSTIAFAQDREFTEEQKKQVKEQLEQHFEKLDLSEEQKSKFQDITKKYALQMQALKTSTKGRLTKYREYKSIVGSKNKEMQTLLSAEQYKIYQNTQKEIQKKMKEKRRNRK